MNLYPNPSNGNFTIELKYQKENNPFKYLILLATVVLSQSIENIGKAIIDGSHLSFGDL
ncbi:MAG: hypothetical protein IPH32_11815 [Bacteroidetes bacterium]|nr:hypothetical protein [Bacteroidota bacterium]